MPTRTRMLRIIPGAAIVLMTVLYIATPLASMEAAMRGISIWWEVLFPALLPFFVLSELLLGLGVVHFAGTLLDPAMRPLFRISGKGGFVMVMGFVSGYPVGARLVARLVSSQEMSREEGERLVSFTTTADPIFLTGAVAVGFFHNPGLAIVLALAHYTGALLTGAVLRFRGAPSMKESDVIKHDDRSIFVRAYAAMRIARAADGRPIGTMMSEAVESGLKLVFVIGGLVVFFCVWIEMLDQIGALRWLETVFSVLLSGLRLDPGLSVAFVNGLFEVTIGAQSAAEHGASLLHKAAAASFLLSWSGLSVHAQIISLLSKTGIRYGPFLLARLIHAAFSTLIVVLSWNVLSLL